MTFMDKQSSLKPEDFYGKALQLNDKLVAWRRTIHTHPELGLKEHRTAEFVSETLNQIGIEFREGYSETGVVGLIRGIGAKTVALRADMDALTIHEETGASYQSKIPGVMHACGHDGHTAMLLGAASILHETTSLLPGQVKLIFQPAEEQSLIGQGGARQMLAEGILDEPSISSIAALHLDPDFPFGTVALRDGIAQASSTTFEIKIIGKAAHASKPYEGVDTIYLAALLILLLQGIVTRETDAIDPKVVSLGEICGGKSPNILASEVLLRGTIRSLSQEMGEKITCLIKERGRNLVQSMGGEAEFSFKILYPPLVNNVDICNIARGVFTSCPGVIHVEELSGPRMEGEDFAFYADKVPAVFFRLGCALPSKRIRLHTADFDIDERVLPLGAALLAMLAIEMLKK
jgi:amidohydrolase